MKENEIKIIDWRNNTVLYRYKCENNTIKKTLIEATRQGANLQGTDLRDADLRGAYLRGTDLQGAYLQGANLRSAYLQGANLQGAYLRGADLQGAYLRGAYLQGANLQGAYLRGANLRSAYLQGANLRSADLQGAYLQGADLQGAYLQGAYLQGANLQGAKNFNKHFIQHLLGLYDQPGRIITYKVVNRNGEGIYRSGIKYIIGKTYTEKNFNIDENELCGSGINVATLDWCVKEWKKGYKILILEFTAKDIACIPICSDGKFRLKKCKVVGEKNLKELGLLQPNPS